MKLLISLYRFILLIVSIQLLTGQYMNSFGQDKTTSVLPNVQRLSAADLLKRVTKQEDPVFSANVLVAQLDGLEELAVEITVNENGDVIAARAVAGFSLLKDAAIEAAKQWKFTPSPKDGFLPIVGVLYFKTPPEMRGNLPHDLAFYQKETEREPQSWLAHCRLGRAYICHKLYQEGEEEYKKAILLNPESPVAFYGLGNSYFRQKEHTLALSAYQQSVKLKPNFVEAYYDIGWRNRALNKLESAIDVFRQAMNARPDPDVKERAYRDIVGIYKKLGKTVEVIEAQEQLIRIKLERKAIDAGLERDFGIAYEVSSLASLYKAAGRYQEAVTNYLKVQEVAPHSDLAFEGLLSAADLCKKIERPLEAEKIYRDFLQKLDDVLKQKISSEREGAAYHIQGIVYEEMGRNKAAVEAYQNAARLRPNWVKPHVYLRRLYLEVGDQSAADQEFGIIKKLDEEVAHSIKEATTITKIK